MTFRDQIEASTNAANTSAVWKHLKLSERERERCRHNYKHKTPTARDCLVLLLMSPMRRGRGGYCWLLWWLKSWNGFANKLQNVMFSKACTNCMYSNSAARARCTSFQSPKHEEILRWNTVTRHHLLIFSILLKACDNVICVTNIFPNS